MISAAETDWFRFFNPVHDTPIFRQGLPDTSTLLLVAAVAFFAVLSLLWSSGRKKQRRRASPLGGNTHLSLVTSRPSEMTDLDNPLVQLDAIATARFERKPMLSSNEARLLALLEALVEKVGERHRVVVGTCMGDLLRTRDDHISVRAKRAALASIQSKQLDFAIIDRRGLLICALEYRDSAQSQDCGLMSDAVKREVLRRAGVPLIEIPARFETTEISAALLRILEERGTGSEHRHAAVNV